MCQWQKPFNITVSVVLVDMHFLLKMKKSLYLKLSIQNFWKEMPNSCSTLYSLSYSFSAVQNIKLQSFCQSCQCLCQSWSNSSTIWELWHQFYYCKDLMKTFITCKINKWSLRVLKEACQKQSPDWMSLTDFESSEVVYQNLAPNLMKTRSNFLGFSNILSFQWIQEIGMPVTTLKFVNIFLDKVSITRRTPWNLKQRRRLCHVCTRTTLWYR